MSEEATKTRVWVDVAPADEIGEGQVRTYDLGHGSVAVARRDGQLYAVQDLCTHDDGPLGEGTLEGFQIECPRHGARFDIRTGAVTQMPAIMPIATFPVMEKDGRISVAVPGDAGDAGDEDW